MATTLLYMRLGNAHDFRTRAQQAADASALAAAGQAADNAARQLSSLNLPGALYNPAAARERAENYAIRNGASLEDIRASDNGTGRTGNIVRVEVSTQQCQRELEPDEERHWNDTLCDGTESEDPEQKDRPLHFGNADAIAQVDLPECGYIFDPDPESFRIIGIRCDGEVIQSFVHARNMIDVSLVGKEGDYIYKPSSWNE
ncbi:hypothetical protein [Nocardiopsis suaedae]|uniref:hypothetical protein n=1 Tax=Nocardiopsis suaedae TaxID=3018444 RepID=UPI0022E747BF|nr:hypothetical protein [Nocardiopsis suaedae]